MELFKPDTRGGRVNHCDCSQTAEFSWNTLRLGSYHSSPKRQNTQTRPLWVLYMSSGRGISWHEKCVFSGSNHTGPLMIKASQQSSKSLLVCFCEKGSNRHKGRASPLSSVCWNKSYIQRCQTEDAVFASCLPCRSAPFYPRLAAVTAVRCSALSPLFS